MEAVEALTIVLAVGTTRSWSSALSGVGAAMLALAVIVAALGPALTSLPIDLLRVLVGGLLLIFGLQWLRKAILRDGEVAFVGGIDLTSLGGDRFDTNTHPMRGSLGWHDASSRVRGPAVADVAEHFASRWTEVTEKQLQGTPPPPAAGEVELQVVRTVPEKVYDFESGRLSALFRSPPHIR